MRPYFDLRKVTKSGQGHGQDYDAHARTEGS